MLVPLCPAVLLRFNINHFKANITLQNFCQFQAVLGAFLITLEWWTVFSVLICPLTDKSLECLSGFFIITDDLSNLSATVKDCKRILAVKWKQRLPIPLVPYLQDRDIRINTAAFFAFLNQQQNMYTVC